MAEATFRIAPTFKATSPRSLRSLVTPMCSSKAAAAQSLRLPELASPSKGSGNVSWPGNLDSPVLGGVERRNPGWNAPPFHREF